MSVSNHHARVHKDPTFGYDPWLTKAAFADAPLDALAGAGPAIFTGADTIGSDIGLLPDGLNVYMSYVDNFGGWTELVNRFAHTKAELVSITIFGKPARCADVEPGAMVPSDLPHWLDNIALHPDGELPWVYTSASNWSNVNQVVGSRKIVRWSAHYGHGPHICGPGTCGFPQADWTQWDDKGAQGQNIDRSIGRVLPLSGHKNPDPFHYAWYWDKPFLINKKLYVERKTVQEYDRLRNKSRPFIYLHRPRLRVLREECGVLASRLATVIEETQDSKSNHRKWRKDLLEKREQGGRVN